jgi:hypothetical protein
MSAPRSVEILVLGAVCWMVLGFSANPAFGSPNKITFGIDKGVRMQMVGFGDTIIFVSDTNFNNSVWVTFAGGTNPCGPGAIGPIRQCTVADNSAGTYAFSLCPDKPCSHPTPTKGKIVVQNSPGTASTVYIALAPGTDVNHVLLQGDTITWIDPNNMKPRNIKFTSFTALGLLNPCQGSISVHQTKPCTINWQWYNWVKDFTYDCDTAGGCSDPIFHLVKKPPNPTYYDAFGLVGVAAAAIIGLFLVGFPIWSLRRGKAFRVWLRRPLRL